MTLDAHSKCMTFDRIFTFQMSTNHAVYWIHADFRRCFSILTLHSTYCEILLRWQNDTHSVISAEQLLLPVSSVSHKNSRHPHFSQHTIIFTNDSDDIVFYCFIDSILSRWFSFQQRKLDIYKNSWPMCGMYRVKFLIKVVWGGADSVVWELQSTGTFSIAI